MYKNEGMITASQERVSVEKVLVVGRKSKSWQLCQVCIPSVYAKCAMSV